MTSTTSQLPVWSATPDHEQDTRRESLTDAMCMFLCKVLVLKDLSLLSPNLHWKRDAKDVDNGTKKTPRLADVLYNEGRYVAGVQKLDYIALLHKLQSDAVAADFLSSTLMEGCDTAPNSTIDLSPYSHWNGFFEYTTLPRYNNLTVGGLAKLLSERVRVDVYHWLIACDREFCNLHSEPFSEPEGELLCLIHALSRDIAKRATLHGHIPNSMMVRLEMLSPAYLENVADVAFVRNRVAAQCSVRNDIAALSLLNKIAESGGGQHMLSPQHVLLLRSLLQSPPVELGLDGCRREGMGMHLLEQTLLGEKHTSERVALAAEWARKHGAFAQTAIEEALRRLATFLLTKKQSVFSPVVTACTSKSVVGAKKLPMLACVATSPHAWYIIQQPKGASTRTGLDIEGSRTVRVISLIWQLLGDGVFQRGMVTTRVLQPVAMEVLQKARVAREIIDHERALNQTGVRMHALRESICDRASDMAGELDIAQCELSSFSTQEIEEVFGHSQHFLSVVAPVLATRTRAMLGNCASGFLPVAYTRFAADTVSLCMPAIKARREALFVPRVCAPSLFGDLLRTVSALRNWTIDCSAPILLRADFRGAHASLLPVLRAFAWANPQSIKSASVKKPIRIEFLDVFALERALRL